MENPTHFIKLKVIWEDPDLIEVRVTASNHRYGGTVEGYLNLTDFPKFIEQLERFPKDSNTQNVIYETVKAYSSFSIKFELILGRVQVSIDMQDEEYYGNKLYMKLFVEPASIDSFHKQLVSLLKNKAGEAILIGCD